MSESVRPVRTIPKNHAAHYPTRVVWYDCETEPVQGPNGWEAHRLTFGWAAYRRRHRGGRWSAPEWYRFEHGGALWSWIESKIPERTRLNVYAHNAGYDWTAANGWDLLPRRGWQLKWSVLDAPPFMLRWQRGRRTLSAADTLNLWRVPLASIGRQLGLEKLPMPGPDDSRETWDRYCMRDVEIIMEACLTWWRWLESHGLGGAQETIASQALTAYRHRYLTHEILLDGDARVLDLSRRAYHGGRVECWSVGQLDGPLYLCDVNSLYPSVMAQGLFPTRLVGIYRAWAPERVLAALEELCAVADVEIETSEPIYPLYTGGRLIFPTGRFRTALPTPELRLALERGDVRAVHEVSFYERAPIFRAWVSDLYRLRREAIQADDAWGSWACKRLMNALYGKFAQRGFHTEEIGSCPVEQIGSETVYSTRLNRRVQIRRMAGRITATWTEGEGRWSQPSIAAEVTSAGRRRLWSLIEQAGAEHVHYMDTDSLVVDRTGLEALSSELDPERLGALHLELEVASAEIRGPKDYRLGERERIKGVRKGSERTGPNTYQVETWVGPRGQLARGHMSYPLLRRHSKVLARVYRKGIVLPTGRTRPYHLPTDDGRWLDAGRGDR